MGNNKISIEKDGNYGDKCSIIDNEVKCLKTLLFFLKHSTLLLVSCKSIIQRTKDTLPLQT